MAAGDHGVELSGSGFVVEGIMVYQSGSGGVNNQLVVFATPLNGSRTHLKDYFNRTHITNHCRLPPPSPTGSPHLLQTLPTSSNFITHNRLPINKYSLGFGVISKGG